MAAQLFRADEATLQARAVRSCHVRGGGREGDSNADLRIGSLLFTAPRRPNAIKIASERTLLGQDAAREQRGANQDCHQHGAHDTEPFLVGRRVGNFALENVAHRTTPSMIVMPSPVPAGACGRKIRGNCGASDAIFEKAGRCSFSVTTKIGSPRLIARGPETSAAARRSAIEEGRERSGVTR